MEAGWNSRRCVQCRQVLPPTAGPRQRYCSNACVARRYRLRRKALNFLILGQSIETALMLAVESGAKKSTVKDLPGRACPGCGQWIFPGYPGSNLRADARHCSARCPQTRLARTPAGRDGQHSIDFANHWQCLSRHQQDPIWPVQLSGTSSNAWGAFARRSAGITVRRRGRSPLSCASGARELHRLRARRTARKAE
jgi:hypothetical protein